MLRVLDRLGPRFAWRASGGASDFAHCSESRQSHKAVSSSCRGRFHARSSTDCPFTSSCSPRPDRQDAVSFRCLAGSTARKGLAPFGVCAFPSARAPTFLSALARSQAPADKNVGAPEKSRMRSGRRLKRVFRRVRRSWAMSSGGPVCSNRRPESDMPQRSGRRARQHSTCPCAGAWAGAGRRNISSGAHVPLDPKSSFADWPGELQKLPRVQMRQAGDVSAVIEAPGGLLLCLVKERPPQTLCAVTRSLSQRGF